MEVLLEYLAKGFMVMLSVSMPCVLVAAAIGLVVGIIPGGYAGSRTNYCCSSKNLCCIFGNLYWRYGFY